MSRHIVCNVVRSGFKFVSVDDVYFTTLYLEKR